MIAPSRILVCGGRDYKDRTRVHATLEDYPHLTHLAQGGASGADALARQWCERVAKKRAIVCVTYPADWKKMGKRAGPARNQRMIDEFQPELVIAFPGGIGTADCVRRAEAAGITVRRIEQ